MKASARAGRADAASRGRHGAAPARLAAPRRPATPAAAAAAVAAPHGAPARRGRALALAPLAMQAGGRPLPQQPLAPPAGAAGAGVGAPSPAAAALAPRSAYLPAVQQPVFLDLSQVLSKPVITRTTGRSLGSLCAAWIDPGRRELVSFDLDDRRAGGGAGGGGARPLVGGAARVGNLPLAALRQIGDVVLVHDEAGLYEPDLDGRLGFVNPIGLEVRTAAGDVLGK
ncbi:hypothetical protein Rsub_13417, partial [Raphidocelis subcapitata]